MPLANSQYDTIMRHYDEIRDRNRHDLEEKKERLYRRYPELKEIDDEVASVSVATARQRIRRAAASKSLSGSAKTSKLSAADRAAPMTDAAYHAEISRLTRRRTEFLVNHHYPADYLQMHYDCPICHDTGFVNGQRCVCFQKAVTDLLYRQYQPGDILSIENFGHFSFDWYSDKIVDDSTGRSEKALAKDAWQAAREFPGQIGKTGNNLYLYGNAGVGKTFLSHCIAKASMEKGYSVLYFSAADLFDVLADAAFSRNESASSYEKTIADCDVLIIDDLGTEFTNKLSVPQLFQVLNGRITRKKSTVISSNLKPSDLRDRYSERISSRITSQYKIKKLVCTDIRIRKKLKGDKT